MCIHTVTLCKLRLEPFISELRGLKRVRKLVSCSCTWTQATIIPGSSTITWPAHAFGFIGAAFPRVTDLQILHSHSLLFEQVHGKAGVMGMVRKVSMPTATWDMPTWQRTFPACTVFKVHTMTLHPNDQFIDEAVEAMQRAAELTADSAFRLTLAFTCMDIIYPFVNALPDSLTLQAPRSMRIIADDPDDGACSMDSIIRLMHLMPNMRTSSIFPAIDKWSLDDMQRWVRNLAGTMPPVYGFHSKLQLVVTVFHWEDAEFADRCKEAALLAEEAQKALFELYSSKLSINLRLRCAADESEDEQSDEEDEN